jgi:hypothetical protein
MTDTTPSSTPGQYQPPGNPSPSPFPAPGQSPAGGFPPPGATPAAEAPAKKSGGARKIISIVVPVLIVAGFIVYRFVLPAIEDAKFKVGACVDQIATSTVVTTSTEDPNIVDCNDAAARARIIEVIENSSISQLDTACPAEAVAGFTRGDTLYCVAAV